MNTKTITQAKLTEIAYDSGLFDVTDCCEDCPHSLSLPSGDYTIPDTFESGQESYLVWSEAYEEGAAQRREYQQKER